MKSELFLIVLLISALSFSCAPPSLVIPKIQYKTTTQVHNEQPDCRLEINAALDNSTQSNILEAFFCYTKVMNFWESEYELLQVQLDTLYEPQEE